MWVLHIDRQQRLVHARLRKSLVCLLKAFPGALKHQ